MPGSTATGALGRALARYGDAPIGARLFVHGRAFLSDLAVVERYVPKKGFIRCEVPDQPRDAMQTVVEIVKAQPGSNQSQIVALAQAAGIGKHQVEDCLKDGPSIVSVAIATARRSRPG